MCDITNMLCLLIGVGSLLSVFLYLLLDDIIITFIPYDLLQISSFYVFMMPNIQLMQFI